MTNKEKTTVIRAELKKLGYTSGQVSVRGGFCGYSDYINIIIKDKNSNIADVKKVCKKFESIDIDERTGEILEGGNTYINIFDDSGVLS